MNEITTVYLNTIGHYDFYYPGETPHQVPTKYLKELNVENKIDRRIRSVKGFTPLLLCSDTGTVIVWRKDGSPY